MQSLECSPQFKDPSHELQAQTTRGAGHSPATQKEVKFCQPQAREAAETTEANRTSQRRRNTFTPTRAKLRREQFPEISTTIVASLPGHNQDETTSLLRHKTFSPTMDRRTGAPLRMKTAHAQTGFSSFLEREVGIRERLIFGVCPCHEPPQGLDLARLPHPSGCTGVALSVVLRDSPERSPYQLPRYARDRRVAPGPLNTPPSLGGFRTSYPPFEPLTNNG